jgi:hypothetical protein
MEVKRGRGRRVYLVEDFLVSPNTVGWVTIIYWSPAQNDHDLISSPLTKKRFGFALTIADAKVV